MKIFAIILAIFLNVSISSAKNIKEAYFAVGASGAWKNSLKM